MVSVGAVLSIVMELPAALLLPAASKAVAWTGVAPSGLDAVLKDVLKGALVSVPTRAPPTRNSTRLTLPELSDAFALRVIVPRWTPPGDTPETLGACASRKRAVTPLSAPTVIPQMRSVTVSQPIQPSYRKPFPSGPAVSSTYGASEMVMQGGLRSGSQSW